MIENPSANYIAIALQQALHRYLESRKKDLPAKWEQLVSSKNCYLIQQRHFLKDMIYNPLNTFWAIPYVSIKKAFEVCEKLGIEIPDYISSNVPKAIKTGFQKEMERLVQTEIFGLTYFHGQLSALALEIEADEVLKVAIPDEERETLVAKAEHDIRKSISEFCSVHNGFTDLAASGGVLLVARKYFRDGSLDIFGIGKRWASRWAHDKAVSKFILGRDMGNMYYRLAGTPRPSSKQVFVATAWSLLMLALFSTAINFLSYPLQNKLGFKKKQLDKLTRSIEDRVLLRFAKAAKHRVGALNYLGSSST